MNAQIFIYCDVYIIRLSPPCTLNNDCRTGGLSAFRAVIPARFQRAPLHPNGCRAWFDLYANFVRIDSSLSAFGKYLRASANNAWQRFICLALLVYIYCFEGSVCAVCHHHHQQRPPSQLCMHDPLRGGREKMHAGAFFLCCVAFGWEGFGCLSTC